MLHSINVATKKLQRNDATVAKRTSVLYSIIKSDGSERKIVIQHYTVAKSTANTLNTILLSFINPILSVVLYEFKWYGKFPEDDWKKPRQGAFPYK